MTGLLLDTHVLFWFDAADPRLPSSVLTIVRDLERQLVLSVVTIYAMGVALAKGRWQEACTHFPNAATRLEDGGYTVLPIERAHVEAAALAVTLFVSFDHCRTHHHVKALADPPRGRGPKPARPNPA